MFENNAIATVGLILMSFVVISPLILVYKVFKYFISVVLKPVLTSFLEAFNELKNTIKNHNSLIGQQNYLIEQQNKTINNFVINARQGNFCTFSGIDNSLKVKADVR